MVDEVNIYVRNKEHSPYAVLNMKQEVFGDEHVIAIGWSKANLNYDTFKKKEGTRIASKRAEKALKYYSTLNREEFNHNMSIDTFHDSTDNLPYSIKQSIAVYMDEAKYKFYIPSNEKAIFIIPIIETIMRTEDMFNDKIEQLLSDKHTKPQKVTRYYIIEY